MTSQLRNDPNLRLAFVCHASLGGSGKAALELARACQRRGYEVVLIAPGVPFGYDAQHDPLLEVLGRAPGFLPCLPYPENCAAEPETMAPELAAIIRRHGIDVLHVHYAQPFAHAAVRLSELLGSDCPARICTLHGTDVIGLSPAKQKALACSLAQMDALTAVSENLAAQVALLPEIARPEVLPNFVDLSRSGCPSPEVRKKGPARLLHVSNFRPVKQTPLLAETLEKILKITDAVLLLAGDGPDRAELFHRLEKKGLTERVVWLGVRQDIPRLLAQVDLALLTSAYESFSLFALEAMSAGVPVVGFATGGLVEVVENGTAGLLVPPNDTDALARAAGELLVNPERRKRMAVEALRCSRRFAESEIVPLYEALYSRLSQTCKVG